MKPIAEWETWSADITGMNVEALKGLFPEAFTEGKIDFEVLKQLLGGAVDEREEKYGLNWHGKRQARQLALTPSTGTLRPAHEDSVDWDTTQNLMIEGDNLEVLKLLQKSYAGKVKMIYIDPPYNTGNDFVYPDNFKESLKNYLELTGQTEGSTRSITSNPESSGRFHTDWLNMIYPRLMLAKNLLRSDGLIFVSIDETEIDNARLVCDQIFGSENHIETLVWKKSYGGGAKEYFVVRQHEYCLLYARSSEELAEFWLPPDEESEERYYLLKDEKFDSRGPYRVKPLEATKSMDPREKLRYSIPAPDGTEVWPKRQWWWKKERALLSLKENELVFARSKEGWTISYKQYLLDETGKKRGAKPFSIVDKFYGQQGTADIRQLFNDEVVLQFPKPVSLIRHLLHFGAGSDNLVLDFFAGSGTTGHAIFEANLSHAARLRFILVQLPEPIENNPDEQSAASRLLTGIGKPLNIAEITKERLRRAAATIKDRHPLFKSDLGFRAFKLDSTNIRPWEPDRDKLTETLEQSVEHIKAGRTDQDILFEILLKLGLELTVAIDTHIIASKTVYSVGLGTLLVCLAQSIDAAEVESLALGMVDWHATLAPAVESTVVFRDSAFADDVAKTNLTAILVQHGLENVRSL